MTVALVANIARPISSAISTAFSADSYGLLSSYGLLGASASPDAVIEALFASSEVGAWYDPSDLTTMFQDSAGTTPVTADGQTVGKILDKSGNGNHATAPSDAARPLYKTDGTYHWLQFDGVDDSLSTAAINFTSTDKMSVFGGILTNMGAYATGLICETSSTIDSNAGSFALSSGAKSYNDFGLGRGSPASGYRASPVYTQPTTKVISGAINIAGTSGTTIFPTLRVNAASVAESFAGNTSDVGTAFGNYSMFIGRRNNVSLPLNGNIYSLIVRGALSTTQEITDTETWVNQRTGAY